MRLARFGEDAGITRTQADAIIEAVVVAASDNDETAHWNLYSVSELLLGGCDPEEKYHRIQRHLELYARASGNPNAVIAVARRYANGTAVADKDPVQAVDWYYYAMALGHKEARRELQGLLGDA